MLFSQFIFPPFFFATKLPVLLNATKNRRVRWRTSDRLTIIPIQNLNLSFTLKRSKSAGGRIRTCEGRSPPAISRQINIPSTPSWRLGPLGHPSIFLLFSIREILNIDRYFSFKSIPHQTNIKIPNKLLSKPR